MTNLPNPLPADTVVFLQDPNNRMLMIRHVLTSPVHLLDEGMVEAVQRVIAWDVSRGGTHALWPEYMPIHEALVAAFAHVLVPPQETGKESTIRDDIVAQYKANPHPSDAQKESLYYYVIYKFADALDAQQKSIDALRAEVKEARNGR